MHGRGGEERKRARHMLTVSTRGTTIVAADDFSSSSSSPDSFCKDGRKITLGDCALFKPPHDAPPFIGIIRWFNVDKENKLKLGVNWLYRPSEVQLGKGILLEAAPNEVFYSFHRDAIPAASLLHPCKVAFLPKDAELPSGILSFVCRRVYDITNKCLWWLNDKDYINERQEEVDQLLFRTQIEMHTTVHPGGRSPKPTSQLKASSDSNVVSAQIKGKKRDRGDQSSEPIKRERIAKTDEGEYGHCKLESFLKSEIAKITDKGGLVDLNGVEKLIQLMLPEASDKKIDLAGRSILAGVIASTEKVECLGQFVHHKGLPVFDEWLQEVHKGKFGDSSSSKECDKSVEEFLLILLRALDKLPINLLALQMCNIGKSVNHLRTHKNTEIQKKARSLVDTWKKRVEAEMSINDSKSGSNQSVPWTTKPRLSEVSHGGRNQGISSEAAMKSTVTQLSTSKAASVKVVHDEVIGKSASASPGSMKSVPSPASASITSKDGVPRTPAVSSANDLPQTVVRDEKSSSSSQSYNNSQSCSSEHAKTGGMGKEDARSSTAGSVAMNKSPGGSSRQRKSVNGFPGSAASGAQRETISGKNTLVHKSTASERISQCGISCDKTPDLTFGEGHGHKFIVKITNRGRSAGLIASAGSFEDPSLLNTRSSSLGLSEKHDHFDCSSKEKGDAHQATVISGVNTESWQSNDIKDVVSNDVQGSLAVFNGEDGCRTTGDIKGSKIVSSSPVNETNTVNPQEPSLSSINALIDSCVKYSDAAVSTSAGDDVGMNLLASVAAGVMSKSTLESPTDSPLRNLAAVDNSYVQNELKVKASNDGVIESKQNVDAKLASQDKEKSAGEPNGHLSSSGLIMNETTMGSLEVKAEKRENISAVSPVSSFEKTKERDGAKPEKTTTGVLNGDIKLESKKMSSCSLTDEDMVNNSVPSLDVEVDMVEGSSLSNPLSESDEKNGGELTEKKAFLEKHPDSAEGTKDEVPHSISLVGDLTTVRSREMNTEKNNEIGAVIDFKRPDKQPDCDANVMLEIQDLARCSTAPNHDGEHLKENLKCKDSEENGGQADPKVLVVFPVQDVDQCLKSRESKLSGVEAEEADESTSTTADASSESAARISDNDTKVGFDLNEGFDVDDGKCGDPSCSTASACLANVRLISPVPFPISTVSSTIPSSITVAAAGKGPFVPPEDLLRSKGERGWKGSAATSAFRPAEPRKHLEVPFGATSTSLSEPSVRKNSRPPLEFDLNIPDERVLEDMNPRSSAAVSVSNNRENNNLRHEIGSKSVRCSGGFDLDLNQVNEFPDASNYTTNNDRRTDVAFSVKSTGNPLRNHLIGEGTVRRNFDLNGPFMDEAGVELSHFSQHAKSNVPSQASVSGLWVNNAELGNLSSWFPPGNTYANATIPSIMTDREEHSFPVVSTGGSQRMLGPTSGVNPFSPDVYRGPVLSSSPAVPFPPAPFQYSVLSFANSFPLPSANYATGSTTYLDSQGGRFCFPAVHSQLLGPTGQVSTHYPRPYVVGLPDGSNSSSPEVGKKWGRQGLDLNAGPGCPDTEGKDETFAPRQLSMVGSQTQQEDRARMYQPAGSTVKRKEPDGGWDGYKQSSWQ